MKFKNFSTHVQRQMNNYLRKYREFVKNYIDDIVIFNKILKEHLQHLQKILNLFREMNIILKSFKTFLNYSNIVLLKQKVNNLELITSKNKLKAIMVLSFSKNLKNLKTYFEMIEYLKNYISYYAQKTESLQKKKIMFLKNGLIKKTKEKILAKEQFWKIQHQKKNAFDQLQKDFNKSN